MRYQHVSVAAFSYTLPPHVVSSDDIEARLAPVYERLGLPAGRLELMSGIRERRFFDPGTQPGEISAHTARQATQASGIDPGSLGALVHGSVCRDQMEPATASRVHHAVGMPDSALVLDVSNACLGLVNGMLLVADMIELGRIRAGVVVGTEIGRPLVEGTIDALLADGELTRKTFKPAFASLTIGSGSAAVVLCDRRLSPRGGRLLGGVFMADTTSHRLCAGGKSAPDTGNVRHTGSEDDDRPQMQTDSEALLHAGVDLAERAWPRFLAKVGWSRNDVDKVFTHQVGRAHRKLLMERLGLDPAIDFPTVEFLGNTGAAALPMAVALGIERGHLQPGEKAALLGIGSGLNAVMLGMEWGADD